MPANAAPFSGPCCLGTTRESQESEREHAEPHRLVVNVSRTALKAKAARQLFMILGCLHIDSSRGLIRQEQQQNST
jgi:hypothetical protein